MSGMEFLKVKGILKVGWEKINFLNFEESGQNTILVLFLFWEFPRGRHIFFGPRGECKLSTFPHGRQKESVFVNFTLFFPNVMTIFSKIDATITRIGHIFHNPVEMSTFNQKFNILSTTWKSWKLGSPRGFIVYHVKS